MSPAAREQDQASDLAIAAKLRERLELIAWWRGGIAPDGARWFVAMQAERLGLISTARALDAIARASMGMLADAESGGASLERVALLYGTYCLALCEAKEAMQQATQTGALVLRSSLTALPLRDAELAEFWGGELRAAVERFDISRVAGDWSPHDSRWPDAWLMAPGGIRPDDLQSWCRTHGIDAAQLWNSGALPAVEPDHEVPPMPGAAWKPSRPKRDRGYGEALYQTLVTIHANGAEAPPTPREVLAAWSVNRPHGITRVLADGFDYLSTGAGEEKTANVAALGKAIGRMTDPKPRR